MNTFGKSDVLLRYRTAGLQTLELVLNLTSRVGRPPAAGEALFSHPAPVRPPRLCSLDKASEVITFP